MDRTELAKRMKGYEAVSGSLLTKRTPVILRFDGKAFHTFTRGFEKPYDKIFMKTMQETMMYLCQNIQGCVLGYTQSDEISLVLVDYKRIDTQPWLGYRTQKMTSIGASMATLAFNKIFKQNVNEYWSTLMEFDMMDEEQDRLCDTYWKAVEKGAMFDCRAFNIPKEEVTNNIYWRQFDAMKNSVQMLGRCYFNEKELYKKNTDAIKSMLVEKFGVSWDEMPTEFKRGSCCVKTDITVCCASENEDGSIETWATERPHWEIDKEIPVFKGDGREYVDMLVFVGE